MFAQELVDAWNYTLDTPAPGWEATSFDASHWKQGEGGFGTLETPGSRIGTLWESNNIWLRKSFECNSIPAKPLLWMHHDEATEVYLNGVLISEVKGYTNEYERVQIPKDKLAALKIGTNILAVHCNQTGGGQFIDVHVVDGDNIPRLPRTKREATPFKSELITTWGAEVTSKNVWSEYPRPLLQRQQWQNLNGDWNYAITEHSETDAPEEWAWKILVPFCLEAKLGGVQKKLADDEVLWYQRTFDVSLNENRRQLLNFEAVDYRCEVLVNGQSVGTHQGGNTPFALDITESVKNGKNELVVRVEDETEEWQLNGKQRRNPNGIFYTQVSGIWQTVWLEEVPSTYLVDLKISTNLNSITVKPVVASNGNVRVVVKDGDQVVAEGSGSESIQLQIENPKLWSPGYPHLYSIEATLLDADGKALDRVTSYTGMRTVGKVKDENGNWRFTLNGEILFHWGPLDQGWWPDGLLTPPSDEAMLFDIEWLKSAGFNMIRKHIKVEPRRYSYHCDRLGMLVWQDQVSAGRTPPWTRLDPNPQDADWPDVEHEQFLYEFEEMISELESHPSIVVWTPFNEAWGQHRTIEVGQWTSERDLTRLVNIASGGNFWPAGDVVDHHEYPHPGFPFELGKNDRFEDYIKVVGEFGGHGYPVKDHLWDANRRNWGYGSLPKDEAEYKERYITSLKILNELRLKGIAAGVYTQTTDVEGEINGLLTYDRKVIKISAEELAEMHKVLYQK